MTKLVIILYYIIEIVEKFLFLNFHPCMDPTVIFIWNKYENSPFSTKTQTYTFKFIKAYE